MDDSDDKPDLAINHYIISIAHKTRFGVNWPGKRCLAKTRRGTPCQKPAITGKGRCQLHGGRSTGPKTAKGLKRLAELNTVHGQRTKERRAEAKALAQANREIWAELKLQVELMKQDGLLPPNWRWYRP